MTSASQYFETTCPTCSQTFDVAPDLAEGTCPHCGTLLRFLDEAPPAAPEAPSLDARPAPEPASRQPVLEAPLLAPGGGVATGPSDDPWGIHSRAREESGRGPRRRGRGVGPPREPAVPEADPAPAERPAAVEGLAVTCPRCNRDFAVAAGQAEGACPSCGADLRFEDRFPEGPSDLPSTCPACGHSHEVPHAASGGACPACGASLAYEDRFGSEPAPAPAAPPESEAAATATNDAAPPPVGWNPAAPAEDSAAASPPATKRARSQREAEPHVAAPAPNAPGAPQVTRPPGGVPYVLTCPVCQKPFSVTPQEREGNCPHCNAPLAFLNEKEYEALQAADERKRAFQKRMQEKRTARIERDRLEADRRALRETQPKRTPLLGALMTRGARKAAPESLARGPEAPPLPTPAPPEPPAPRRGKKAKNQAEQVAAPMTPEPPSALPSQPTESKKPGLLSRWRKRSPEPTPAPSVQAEPPIQAPMVEPPPRRGKRAAAPPPAVVAEAAVEISAAATPFEATPRPSLLSRLRRTRAQPPAAPAPEESSAKPSKKAKSGAVAGPQAEESAAQVSAAPPGGFLGRLRRAAPKGPTSLPAADAIVEVAAIDWGASEAPALKTPSEPPAESRAKKSRRGKAPASPAPATAGQPAASVEEGPERKKGIFSRFLRRGERASSDAPAEPQTPSPEGKKKGRREKPADAPGAPVEASIEWG